MRFLLRLVLSLFSVLLSLVVLSAALILAPTWAVGVKTLSNVVTRQLAVLRSFNEPLQATFEPTTLIISTVTVTAYRGFLCPEVAQGTGFFLGDRTTIVTAWHVAAEAGDICQLSARLSNGERVSAQKWQRSRYADVAVLKLLPNAAEERQLRLISSLQIGLANPNLGQPLWVLAINRKAALPGRSMGQGRCGEVPDGLFFSNPVLPGDSGSPLVDAEGRVVGVVTGGGAYLETSWFFGLIRYSGAVGCAVPIRYIRGNEKGGTP